MSLSQGKITLVFDFEAFKMNVAAVLFLLLQVAEKPFNSTNKYQYSIHKSHNAITGSFGSYFLGILLFLLV